MSNVAYFIVSLDFMLRVALIPRGVVNHDEDKPSCIQSERNLIRGGLVEKQRVAQALCKVFVSYQTKMSRINEGF